MLNTRFEIVKEKSTQPDWEFYRVLNLFIQSSNIYLSKVLGNKESNSSQLLHLVWFQCITFHESTLFIFSLIQHCLGKVVILFSCVLGTLILVFSSLSYLLMLLILICTREMCYKCSFLKLVKVIPKDTSLRLI